jgi:hypothetical protein
VGYFWRGRKREQALWAGIPNRFKLRSDVAFVHSALFMMDAIALTDREVLPGDSEFSDRS